MTPDITEIIKVSLTLANNIIFYLPRTLLLDDLLDILYPCLEAMPGHIKPEHIFFDVQILKSSDKIKALLIIFGLDVNNEATTKNIREYLTFNYPYMNNQDLYCLTNVAKILGNGRFFANYYKFKKNYKEKTNSDGVDEDFIQVYIQYLKDTVLTNEQTIKLNSLNNNNIGFKNKRISYKNNGNNSNNNSTQNERSKKRNKNTPNSSKKKSHWK